MSDETAECLARVFRRIHDARMRDLPILNPNLSVQVVGGRRVRGDWVGILITPWCMNLVLVPGPGSVNWPGSMGSKQCIRFPAGDFEFIASEEPDIGPFAACSLFSPMGDFPDQAAASATAEAAFEAVFASVEAREVPEDQPALTQVRGLSRRDLLRGVFRRGG